MIYGLVNCSLSVVGFRLCHSLVSMCRKVVAGLWVTRMSFGSRIHEMDSVPLM